MTDQTRERIVVFRLSQDEYQALKEACGRAGARTLSDFTRREILDFLRATAHPDRLNIRVATLEQEIAGLKASIEHLHHFVEGAAHVEPATQV